MDSEYIADLVIETVDFVRGESLGVILPFRPLDARVEFAKFVSKILWSVGATMQVVVVALVYLDRARPFLCLSVEEWALERVFLGALITAAKVGLIFCSCQSDAFIFGSR